MLNLRGIGHAYHNKPVLHDINLNIESGEILCLLGPSGCGKTTLLRIIAGLEQGYGGHIHHNGKDVRPIPVHERGFGFMFQDFALFPHMNVSDNVGFGLRMQSFPPVRRIARVQEMLMLVGLAGFEKRDVSQLSGGEKQRVALARSLAPNPQLLMLDEPLGSLDAALREKLIIELRAIIKKLGLTAIYVTHDQQEAYTIADRIAIMNIGRIEQIGTPQEIYNTPKTVFVARFLGMNNIVPVLHQENGIAQTPIGDFPLRALANALLIHPDGIQLSANSQGKQATIEDCLFRGDFYQAQVRIGEHLLSFKLPGQAPIPRIGDTIHLKIDPESIIPLQEVADF